MQRKGFSVSGWSLREQLIICFTVMALLPLLLSILLAFYNDRNQIIQNRNQLATMDARQIAQEFDNVLSGYEDVLYQLYTDDELSNLVEGLNHQKDVAVTRNQIRRKLRSVFWLQDDIASITIVTQSGEVIFYDRLSYAQQQNVSFDSLGYPKKELYELISSTRGMSYFSTQYVTYFGGQDYRLFYIGHSMISQQAISDIPAVILMGIDADLFRDAFSRSMMDRNQQQYLFALDQNQQILWYPDVEMIGKSIGDYGNTVRDFVKQEHQIQSSELAIYRVSSSLTGWEIVYVLDSTPFTQAIDRRLQLTILLAMLSFGLVIGLVCVITNQITSSVKDICNTMQAVSGGNLTVRTGTAGPMASEIRTIAVGLNAMADQLQIMLLQKQESAEKVKNAEIAALEAQLNPHFLYNTLDTINWMAIEREEYPISNVISALGQVLRYAIDNSNGIVTLEEEERWLKQYLFIHQNRLKGGLTCQIDIDPELRQCRVHKLLFQPFIENAMIHGFAQKKSDCHLQVLACREEGKLRLEIRDNGCGIPLDIMEKLDTSQGKIEAKKRYRGMQNALNRLLLYYADQAEISIQSSETYGTHVSLRIPFMEGACTDANCNCGG